jgi:hypothetical protein
MAPTRWQQIRQVYECTLKRNENERAAFVEHACAGDPELRREVESLLAYHDPDDAFIETPALEVAARALVGKPAEPLIGRQLGSYTILALVGVGGS